MALSDGHFCCCERAILIAQDITKRAELKLRCVKAR